MDKIIVHRGKQAILIAFSILALVMLNGCGKTEETEPQAARRESTEETIDPSVPESLKESEDIAADNGPEKVFPTRVYWLSSSEGVGENDPDMALESYPLWSAENLQDRFDDSAPEKMTITFQGKEYTGEYEKTSLVLDTCYYSDYYRFDGGHFSIKKGEEDINYFSRFSEASGEKSVEECVAIAKEFADKYIDTDAYIMEQESSPDLPWVSVMFTANYKETPVRSWFSVFVDHTGEIIMFNNQMTKEWAALQEYLGEEKLNEMADYLLSEEVEKQALESCQTLYEQKKVSSGKVTGQYLVCLEENRLGLITYIETEYKLEDEYNMCYVDSILTVIENE